MTLSNGEILQSAFAAFGRGDIPAVLAIFDEGIVWHAPGANLVAGTYTGHQELVGFFMKLGELSAGTVKVTPSEIFDNGSGAVVALVTITAERGGQPGVFDAVQLWRFDGGKATSCNYFYVDQAALDAFWS